MLAISDEPADLVGPYVERFRLKMPVAAGSTARYSYGINAFPTAVLIGPDGRIAWKGHYKELKDSILANVLKDVVLGSPLAFTSETVWEGPVGAAARLAAEGELAEAFAALETLRGAEDTPAGSRAQADELAAALTSHVKELVATARQGLAKDPIASWRLGERLARELDGHALEAHVRAFLEELAKDETLAREIAARKELDAAMKVLDKRGLHRARGKLEALVQRFPGTQAAEDARALLAR